MSTEVTLKTHSTSSVETESLGEKIGRKLRGGEIIELVSDIGGGKTTFVRGLARGLGSHDSVSSPTFTVQQEYQAGKLTLHHFDFYRLHEPGVMALELKEVLENEQAVVVIEWADIVKGVLPNGRLSIFIKAAGEDSRDIEITCPPSLTYLIEEIA